MAQELDDAEDVERARMRADELSWSLRSVTRAAEELDHAVASRLGLRATDYEAMGHIMSRGADGLGPRELGHRLGMSTGSATELADRLERAGHIRRARSVTDRRRVDLVAQEPTVARVLGHLAPLFDALDGLADDYTEAERAAIDRYLRAAAEQLRTHAERLAGGASDSANSFGDVEIGLDDASVS